MNKSLSLISKINDTLANLGTIPEPAIGIITPQYTTSNGIKTLKKRRAKKKKK